MTEEKITWEHAEYLDDGVPEVEATIPEAYLKEYNEKVEELVRVYNAFGEVRDEE